MNIDGAADLKDLLHCRLKWEKDSENKGQPSTPTHESTFWNKARISQMFVIQSQGHGCTENASYVSATRLSSEIFPKVRRNTSLQPLHVRARPIRSTRYIHVSLHVGYEIEAQKGGIPIVVSSNKLVRCDTVVEFMSISKAETFRDRREAVKRFLFLDEGCWPVL